MMRKKVDYTDELERVNEIEAKLKKKSVSMNAGKYTTVAEATNSAVQQQTQPV